MLLVEKVQIPKDLQDLVYHKFKHLPLKSKLVIYSKLIHGANFKSQSNDFFNLNPRSISKIYRNFIENIKESENE
jgi:hypothetical protein